MKYEKPEIVVAVNAVATIQNMAKNAGVDDSSLDRPSIPAYESDE